MSLLRDTFKALLGSRKAVVMLGGVIAYAASRIGLDISAEDTLPAIAVIGGYLVGQGIADAGKGKPSDEDMARYDHAAQTFNAAAAALERKLKELEPMTARLPLVAPPPR